MVRYGHGGKPVSDYEPEFCCNGFECGCYGRPINPCVCSSECEDVCYGQRGRSEINIWIGDPMQPTDSQLFWMCRGIRQYLVTDKVGRDITEEMIGILEDDTNDDQARNIALDTLREALFPTRNSFDIERMLSDMQQDGGSDAIT